MYFTILATLKQILYSKYNETMKTYNNKVDLTTCVLRTSNNIPLLYQSMNMKLEYILIYENISDKCFHTLLIQSYLKKL